MPALAADRSIAAGADRLGHLEPVLRHGGWFIFFLLLAPVIGPRGYGVFVTALSGVAIAEAVFTETVTAVLVRAATLDRAHAATALAISAATGAGLTLILSALAGPLSAMIDSVAFGDIFRSLALLPLLGGLAVVPTAQLRRDGRHGPFLAATAAGIVAGGAAAVALAWAGAGAWSLAAQLVVQRFASCAVLWLAPAERIGLGWSPRHFAELFGTIGWGALEAAWPAVLRYAPVMAVALALGPIAGGLYMLAARLAEAVVDIFPTRRDDLRPPPQHVLVDTACRVLFPAVLAAALLPVIVPPLLDARWWGAVLPAQILLVVALPAALVAMGEAVCPATAPDSFWRLVRLGGVIAVTACAASWGMAAAAAVQPTFAMTIAAASLARLARSGNRRWLTALAPALPRCAGAAAVAAMLAVIAGPLGRTVAPLSAACLLIAGAWLCDLVVRRRATGARLPAGVRRASPAWP